MPSEIHALIQESGLISTLSANDPQLIVFKVDRHVSQEVEECFRQNWKMAVEGTSLEHVKCVVLSPGWDMEIIDRVDS